MGFFGRQKKEDAQFNKDLAKASEMLYAIGDKLDFFPEYQDRFILIQQQLEQIKTDQSPNSYKSLQSIIENLKHLQLDIETKEMLS